MPRRLLASMYIIASLILGPGAVAQDAATLELTFDDEASLADASLAATGEAAKRMPKPKLIDGKLYLLESWWKSTATAAWAAPTETPVKTVDIAWTLLMNTGTEGAGFAWMDIATHGTDAASPPEFDAWEAPSIAAAFGVGFDASNPPNRDPFRGSGNIYDRPQHEISLHWDGMEIVKRTTETEFRDEAPHRARTLIEFVVGGANVSVWLDDELVFDRYFIARMTAFAGRPVFGARNSEQAGDVLLDDLRITCTDPITAPEPPLHITGIDRQLNDHSNPNTEAMVAFPDNTDAYGRIICTLRLDKPETRFDPWDRLANVYIDDDAGQRFELIRYITPYHKGHVWHVDVTDFRPLLTGTKRVHQSCSTQGEGWVVSVHFDFYPGESDRHAYRVVNLWSGSPTIGDPDAPPSDFYVTQTIDAEAYAVGAAVRTVVTGHGMHPNSNNAAEFMPIDRTLTVNDESFVNRLWKTDNYLNPCRPQGGTWKYDRAGWAPGDVTAPWIVDVSDILSASRTLRIGYELAEYINENRGQTWAPFHRTEAHLILYRAPAASTDSADAEEPDSTELTPPDS